MSLREDFQQALALQITHLLKLAAEQRGGIHVLLMGIPDHRDRSFRAIVTADSDAS